ncbi:ABC transporter permease subunit [Paenibacillus profundus]|uniref:ABC transporter permease subunit n=1 Tax=Paenibacillus profundus TaxID=1173085 RepID=A0ABS8YDR2_9BACL|nr:MULTISPECIES: ABC transporter permease subunit [Paenibacillus]MCE5169801.1 ABC transporter permease subunit [Paenibacillus profundus]MCM3341127.1 ABC transporter permease subunit [Paenibacillus sp. MER TA 81-3]
MRNFNIQRIRKMAGAIGNPLGNKIASSGLYILLMVIVVGILAPMIAPHDPLAVNLTAKLLPPSLEYPLGTDQMGRCVFSRIISGTMASLVMPLTAMALILLIGMPLGVIAGYYGGVFDRIIMVVVNTMLSFPNLLLAIVLTGFLGPGTLHILLAVVAVWWAKYTRIVRGMTLSLKEKPYVKASRGCGSSDVWLMFRHIVPGTVPTVLVFSALDVGRMILAISGLAFLGLGVAPPSPEWGAMLSDGRHYLQTAPRLLLSPGLAILLVMAACNLLGEGLRDALDVKR